MILVFALLVPGLALAEEPPPAAVDALYDAVDAIEEARKNYDEGRISEGDRLLTVAEDYKGQASGAKAKAQDLSWRELAVDKRLEHRRVVDIGRLCERGR